MEFPFVINNYLKSDLVKVTNTLIPRGYTGDRRSFMDCASKISEILDDMGVASARAQDLKKAITSGEKIRNSDHDVYFLIDKDGKGGNGSVVGLLKVGWKELYLYDAHGSNHKMQALCVLDFYIHESKQRMGCGKYLYEFMLQDQHVKPQELAIDRPSDKFLGFLHKHYGLESVIPQANNYVVFTEFFNEVEDKIDSVTYNNDSMSASPKVLASFPAFDGSKRESYNGLQQATPSYGRHAAHKPVSTMGKILHSPAGDPLLRNSTTPTATGPNSLNGSRSTSPERRPSLALQDPPPKSLFLHSTLW